MNPGKQFEDDFKKSVPKEVYYLRLHDSAIGFDIENSTQRFALQSPYDVVLCNKGRMYALELKSTKDKSFSFSGKTPKIKPRQVDELIKAENSNAIAGLVLNFREQVETYFIKASEFKNFMEMSSKKSINIAEVRKIGTLLPCRKLQVHYRYDLDVLLQMGR